MIAEWQAECEGVRSRKEGAHAARSKAESDYANARTQQEAERAERALKDAIASLKVSHWPWMRETRLGKGRAARSAAQGKTIGCPPPSACVCSTLTADHILRQ